jgi:bifunctional DNA-binding transcriptional regulator/antitoxin component of YhaV-PrlF toxin-antitoxin module
MTVIVKNKIPLVVPPTIRRKAGLKSGQEVEFRIVRGIISIHPKISAADDEYTPRERRIINASIAKGLADFKAGKTYGPFSTHKEFIASLHREIKRIRTKRTKLLAR